VIAELVSLLTSVAFWLTFVGISAVPYAMYLVAYVFGSRRPGDGPNNVPVWKDQSRAYMPGDFGLALMVAVCLQYRGDVPAGWATSGWFVLVSIFFGLSVFLFARRFLYTPKDYTKEAWNSPSKLWHDFVMFLLFSVAASYVCLPVYFATDWTTLVLVKVLSFFGLSLWVVGNVYDFTHDETPNKRQHADTYQPIWRKSSQTVPSR